LPLLSVVFFHAYFTNSVHLMQFWKFYMPAATIMQFFKRKTSDEWNLHYFFRSINFRAPVTSPCFVNGVCEKFAQIRNRTRICSFWSTFQTTRF
jgi:hypothetical protein